MTFLGNANRIHKAKSGNEAAVEEERIVLENRKNPKIVLYFVFLVCNTAQVMNLSSNFCGLAL